MNDSYCVCGGNHIFHFAPNDVSVILKRKTVESCAHCDTCPKYRHAKGPVPKPRSQPSEATIKAVREAEYRRSNPAPRPVPAGTRNTYSSDRDVPV